MDKSMNKLLERCIFNATGLTYRQWKKLRVWDEKRSEWVDRKPPKHFRRKNSRRGM